MSGLALQFHRDGRVVEAGDIWPMLEVIPYRGPDGTWVRTVNNIGLGFAKLTVTPQELDEEQPLVSPRTGCAIIADVRLDNREALLDRLTDRLPADISDAELVLRCYERWGVDIFPHLLGDFAVVIWDPRQQRVVCARDTAAQRPLFYRIDDRTFAAASEIHQLLQDPTVPIAPNEEMIRNLFAPINLFRNEKDQSNTYYQGIFSVQAGHFMIVTPDSISERQYWEMDPPKTIRYRSDDEYAEHFRSVFFEAIRTRMRTVHPVGALLSGGLDSSSVVCSAQELIRRGDVDKPHVHGFSLVFDGLDCDERELIQDIEAKYEMPISYLHNVAYRGWLRTTPRNFQMSPLIHESEIQAIYAAAIDADTRVLLTGDVADGCIRGTRMVFDSLLLSGRFRELSRQLRTFQRLTGQTWKRILVSHCLTPLLPLAIQREAFAWDSKRTLARHRDRLIPSWIPNPLRDELADRHIRLRLEEVRSRKFRNSGRQMEYLSLAPPETPRPAIGWPLEIVRPYTDRRLHEFLLAIPQEQKFIPHPETDSNYAGSKQMLRRSLTGILPESIRTRVQPTHFGSVFSTEVKERWELYESAFHPSGNSEIALRGYVDKEAFWSRLEMLRDVEGYGLDHMFVMRMVALETWLRTFHLPRQQQTIVPTHWGDPSLAFASGLAGPSTSSRSTLGTIDAGNWFASQASASASSASAPTEV